MKLKENDVEVWRNDHDEKREISAQLSTPHLPAHHHTEHPPQINQRTTMSTPPPPAHHSKTPAPRRDWRRRNQGQWSDESLTGTSLCHPFASRQVCQPVPRTMTRTLTMTKLPAPTMETVIAHKNSRLRRCQQRCPPGATLVCPDPQPPPQNDCTLR